MGMVALAVVVWAAVQEVVVVAPGSATVEVLEGLACHTNGCNLLHCRSRLRPLALANLPAGSRGPTGPLCCSAHMAGGRRPGCPGTVRPSSRHRRRSHGHLPQCTTSWGVGVATPRPHRCSHWCPMAQLST